MTERDPCVYIMASGTRGYIYIGVTSDLPRRVYEHRNGIRSGWARLKRCRRLVRYEMFGDMTAAIEREKQLKNWHRQWKINLINSENPQWVDLAVGLGLPPLASL